MSLGIFILSQNYLGTIREPNEKENEGLNQKLEAPFTNCCHVQEYR